MVSAITIFAVEDESFDYLSDQLGVDDVIDVIDVINQMVFRNQLAHSRHSQIVLFWRGLLKHSGAPSFRYRAKDRPLSFRAALAGLFLNGRRFTIFYRQAYFYTNVKKPKSFDLGLV